MELGAGLGFISTFCAKIIGSNRVHAFEANPSLQAPIRKMHQLNGVSPQVQLCAVGAKEGELCLNVSRHFWHSTAVGAPMYGMTRSVRVPVLSYDSQFELLRPTVVVLDIEGGEIDLLALDLATLRYPRAWVVEFHPALIGQEKVDLIQERLAEAGFKPLPGDKNQVLAFLRDK